MDGQNVQLKIVIDPQGNVKVEVVGMVGPACLTLTSALEQALAGGQESQITREFKPEYEYGFEVETSAGLENQQHAQRLSEGF